MAATPGPRGAQSGQALVEAALTLPLMLFCVLGTTQLFMMLQARIMAEYAVYRAVRAGSLNHGDCQKMTHAAVLSLLPTIARTDDADSLAAAFKLRRDNHYHDGQPQHQGQIVEIVREKPEAGEIPPVEDKKFDQPNQLMRLEVRMVFWYRLKIPFADWVMSRMFLAHDAIQAYNDDNPLNPAEARAGWPDDSPGYLDRTDWPGGPLADSMRKWADDGQYLFPLRVNFGMRMMTPAQQKYFSGGQGCPL